MALVFGNYKQYDSRWGSKNYNGSSTYSVAGCGPTSVANIIYAITPSVTPVTTGNYMKKNGYAIRNNGTAWAGIPATLKAFGATDVQQVDKMANVWNLMAKGYVGVFLFSKGSKGSITWTTSGHYIAVTDYKVQNGKHYVYTRDSGGRNHTGWYCYETQMKGLIPRIWLCKVGEWEDIPKPTTKYTGELPTTTIKYGTKGTDVTLWQKFLNWYYSGFKLAEDGICGSGTEWATRRFQDNEGLEADGIVGKNTRAKANEYKEEVSPQPYSGDVPNWVNLSAQIITHEAKRLAYPAGTKASKYTWNKKRTTSAVAAFVTAINNVYPKRSGWSKQCQDGASCDVFVGTVLRSCGAFSNIPRGLSEQIPYLAKQGTIKNMGIKSTANFQAGDIGIYIGKTKGAHIWINVSGKTVAEASHTLKYFGHLKARKYTSSNKKTWKCYRFVKPIRSYIKKGDVGSEVTKVQKMLNWAIDAGLATDGDAGDKTHEAIIKFQSTYGLTQDGFFGQDCVNKVLELKK